MELSGFLETILGGQDRHALKHAIDAERHAIDIKNQAIQTRNSSKRQARETRKSISNQLSEYEKSNKLLLKELDNKYSKSSSKTHGELVQMRAELVEIKSILGINGKNDGSSYTSVSTVPSDTDDIGGGGGDNIKEPETPLVFDNTQEDSESQSSEDPVQTSEHFGDSSESKVRRCVSGVSDEEVIIIQEIFIIQEEYVSDEESVIDDLEDEIPYECAIEAC